MYESFWSILHKFSYLNVCSPNEITSNFIGEKRLFNFWKDRTIIKKQWLDCKKLERYLKISKELLENAFLDNFLFDDEINWFSCQTLRYCPICISKGFHSVIHQMLFLNQCPFHRVELKETCPNCNQPISMHFNPRDFKTPYSCPQCHHRFFYPSSEKVWDLKNNFFISFGEIGQILKRRKCFQPKRANLMLLATNTVKGAWLDIFSRKIFKIWKMFYSNIGIYEIDINKNEFSIYESNRSSVTEDFFDELVIYKSFKEFLAKIIKIHHRKCFEIMKGRNWTVIRSGVIEEIYVCPIVKAYLVWRQYWEGDNKALYMFQPPYSKTNNKNLFIKTHVYSMNKWLGSHVLWEELAGTFLEALRMVSVIEDVGFVNRYPARLGLNQVPYWESYYDQEAQIIRFFHTARINLSNCCKSVRH